MTFSGESVLTHVVNNVCSLVEVVPLDFALMFKLLMLFVFLGVCRLVFGNLRFDLKFMKKYAREKISKKSYKTVFVICV